MNAAEEESVREDIVGGVKGGTVSRQRRVSEGVG